MNSVPATFVAGKNIAHDEVLAASQKDRCCTDVMTTSPLLVRADTVNSYVKSTVSPYT